MAHIMTALIGNPVEHSLSPAIHNYWIKQCGLDGAYEAIGVLPDNLGNTIDRLKQEGYGGFNVTLPYKQTIMEFCDFVDITGKQIEAVNTVRIDSNGLLHGSNTDAFGFIESIMEDVPSFDFSSVSALVLGAGGAARAVAFALKKSGVRELLITNRTKEKAQELASSFGGDVVDWSEREQAAERTGLIVNTTCLGMAGKEPLLFDLRCVAQNSVVCDIVYAPLKTDLLRAAEEKGCKTVSGIGMLLHQARPAFKAWYGTMPEITEELRDIVTEGL